ncbi:MAG: class II aldolase/adducin family protein [Thaumarchaeota archaeon]|nr:class II aldolase/adducin family protein [Nitrososphaerota archaeon]
MEEEEIKAEICNVMKNLYEKNLVASLGGNVSARLPGKEYFWITPTTKFKAGLKPEDLLKVSVNGELIEGKLRPSSETKFHAAIYSVRNDVNAVVHAHNPISTALASLGIEIKPITVNAVLTLGKLKVLEYETPGSKELAEKISANVGNSNVLILGNHGVVGLGKDLAEAANFVEMLEEVSKINLIAFLLQSLDKRLTLKTIPEDEVKALIRYFCKE